jgi:DNA-binding beta-propeller fold protein YncE
MRKANTVAWALGLTLAAVTQPAWTQQNPSSRSNPAVQVSCDLACNWLLDGQAMGSLGAGESRPAPAAAGQHWLAAVTTDGLDKVEKALMIKAAGQVTVAFKLLPVRNARYEAARMDLRKPTTNPRIVVRIAVPANAAASLVVNPRRNKIYVSGGASDGQQVVEIDGTMFALTVLGAGSGASVDTATNHVWAAGVYGGTALVYDGSTRKLIHTVRLGACPVGTAYDPVNKRAWVGAQCSGGNDPTWAVNGGTYEVEAGPFGSGGVYWGNPIVNPLTGRAYFGATNNGPPASLCIDPAYNFKQTTKPFGNVGAVDTVNRLLFAVPAQNATELQILGGGPGPEAIVRTVSLPFSASAGGLDVDPAAGRLYASNAAGNSIEVLNEATGASLATIALGAGNSAQRLAADPTRHLLYALVLTANGAQLFVIQEGSAK